jgi:AcrR family transcriptional regulator
MAGISTVTKLHDGGAPDTPERILDTAERLFAEHGIEAASVRAITQAAGVNIAALHYHFGSKNGLVRALVERRVAEVNAERARMLDELEATDGEVDPRAVAEVWVRPLAAMALDPTGARCNYVPFLAVLHSSSADLRDLGRDAFQPHFARLSRVLERALPQVAPEVRNLRFTMAVDATVRALADLDRTAAPWRRARRRVDDDELIELVIDAIAGLLAGPPTISKRPARSRSENRRRSS